ncbi:unnamed protein product [Fraxinus pennsylvanica]|uniref:RING-type domain-containing protein n=1 Tax=Fraxinus pennsylvanica TaxID=56036 RepID=A0AAD1YQ11_9LAMI|nr:unnamed protein product [Fraxinus pennsylvanica]
MATEGPSKSTEQSPSASASASASAAANSNSSGLRKPVFVKVDSLKPGTNGHTLIVKVLNSNTVLSKKPRNAMSFRGSQNQNTRIAECLIGDETGTILFTARNNQVKACLLFISRQSSVSCIGVFRSVSSNARRGPYEDGKTDATISFNDDNFVKVDSGKMNPQFAFMRGAMKIKGSMNAAQKFTPDIFSKPSKITVFNAAKVTNSSLDRSPADYEVSGEVEQAIKNGDTAAAKKLLSQTAVFNQTEIAFSLMDHRASLDCKKLQGETTSDCTPATLQYKKVCNWTPGMQHPPPRGIRKNWILPPGVHRVAGPLQNCFGRAYLLEWKGVWQVAHESDKDSHDLFLADLLPQERWSKRWIMPSDLMWKNSIFWTFASSDSLAQTSSRRNPSSSANLKMVKDSLSSTTFGNIQHRLPENCDMSCAVCLNQLRKKSQVWELRNCRHVFHKHCLEKWLSYDGCRLTCPLCRVSLQPTPLPEPPHWAVERMLYLFGDDLLP